LYCIKCGTQLPDDAAFCYKCGAKVGFTSTQPAPSASGGPAQSVSSPAQPVLAGADVKELKCPSCGAPITPKFGEMVITCEYCGSSVSLSPEGWRSIQKHTMFLPTFTDKDRVLGLIHQVMDRGIIHRHLQESSTLEEMSLTMVPYWLVPVSARTTVVAANVAAEVGTVAATGVLAGILGGEMGGRRGGMGGGGVVDGLLTGATSLRLRGHFFIMVTLLIPLATADFLNYALTEDGSIFGVNALVNNTYYIYNASLVIFAVAAVTFFAVANSRLGLVLKSIRENEVAAESLGINTSKFKMVAFALSNLFAGMIGAVYVFSNGVASPTDFGLLFSALPVFMCALGGMGTIVGPIIGTILLEGSIDLLRVNYIQDARLLIAALLLLLVLLFFPKGIWGYIKRGG